MPGCRTPRSGIMRSMTAPWSRPTPRYTSEPDPDRKFELTVARREDVRRLAELGPPDFELPPIHGGRPDSRYPATTGLRHVLAFFIDLVLHAGPAAAVGFVVVAQQSEVIVMFSASVVLLGL